MENSCSSFTFPGKVHKPTMRIKLLIIENRHNAYTSPELNVLTQFYSMIIIAYILKENILYNGYSNYYRDKKNLILYKI